MSNNRSHQDTDDSSEEGKDDDDDDGDSDSEEMSVKEGGMCEEELWEELLEAKYYLWLHITPNIT